MFLEFVVTAEEALWRYDLDKYTLIGYALLCYIGEILRRGMHNLSYNMGMLAST